MPRLVIAAGTPDELSVLDVRDHRGWAIDWMPIPNAKHDEIFWHHTVTDYPGDGWLSQYEHLIKIERTAPYGLPYNFVLFDELPWIPWYVNDVDIALPHTNGHNDDVAIAAVGNYETTEPSDGLIDRMARLTRAVWRLWHHSPVAVRGHRDVYPTLCPGRRLYARIGSVNAGDEG